MLCDDDRAVDGDHGLNRTPTMILQIFLSATLTAWGVSVIGLFIVIGVDMVVSFLKKG